MPGMEVVRMDHYNEDKTAFLSQLLHISCVEKILYMSRRSRKRAGVGEQAERDSLLQQEAIVHTWHTLGRRFRGDTWEEILPYSIVRAYVKAKEDGLVKNVDEFLEGEKL
jgi:hypothetical protein